MKRKLIAVPILLLLFAVSCSHFARSSSDDEQPLQADQVPLNIRDAFAATFPSADGTLWEREGKLFEAEFVEDGETVEVYYSPDSAVHRMERSATFAALPPVAQTHLLTEVEPSQIRSVEKVTKSTTGESWDVEVEKSGKEWIYLYKADGSLISRELDD